MIFRVISRSAPMIQTKDEGWNLKRPCKEAFKFMCHDFKDGKPRTKMRWVVNLYNIDQLMAFEKKYGPLKIEKVSSWEEPLLTID